MVGIRKKHDAAIIGRCRFVEGLTFEEIAQTIEYPPLTRAAILYRVRAFISALEAAIATKTGAMDHPEIQAAYKEYTERWGQ